MSLKCHLSISFICMGRMRLVNVLQLTFIGATEGTETKLKVDHFQGTGIAVCECEASHIEHPPTPPSSSAASGPASFCHIILFFHLFTCVIMLQAWRQSQHKQEGKCKLVNFTCLHRLHINNQWNWLTPDNHNPPVEPTHEAWPDVFLCHVDEHTLGLLQPFVELFSLDYLLHSWEVLITPSCCCSMFLRGKTTPIWISSASCPVTLQPGGDDSSEGHEPDTTALQL